MSAEPPGPHPEHPEPGLRRTNGEAEKITEVPTKGPTVESNVVTCSALHFDTVWTVHELCPSGGVERVARHRRTDHDVCEPLVKHEATRETPGDVLVPEQ